MVQQETMSAAIRGLGTQHERGLTFIDETGKETFRSYAEVQGEAYRRGRALLDLGMKKGDRVVLVIPENEDFALTYLGAVAAGLVPVPTYPPFALKKLDAWLDHLRHVIRISGARVLVTSKLLRMFLGSGAELMGEGGRIVTTAQCVATDDSPIPDEITPDDLAFLQFTSGSTARPKGVAITHGNLVNNIRMTCVEGLALDPSVDCGVSWLPLYHDMGLIGFLLAPLYTGTSSVLLPPLSFLRSPLMWLQAISRHRGSVTFSPNFGFALATRRVPESEVKNLDLSSMRAAGCGAEPIRAQTLNAFAERYAPAGFRPEALMPSYGMAEATVGISFSRWDIPMFVDRVDAAALGSGQARPSDSPDAAQVVGCGKAFPGHDVGAFDDAGCRLPDRAVGELRVRGPSVAQGYFGDPEATRTVFADGWLRTGDLGYVVDGEILICGRSKDLIIRYGRNYYPSDIEAIVGEVTGVRTGNVVAFGVPAEEGGEDVVVVAEVKDAALQAEIEAEVRLRINGDLGLVPRQVVLVPPATLPKTSSGKLRRGRTRELFLEHDLVADAAPSLRTGAGIVGQLVRSVIDVARDELWSRAGKPK